MRQASLVTKGMHCGGCESRIERVLARLDGVSRVEADHSAERVEVAYDEAEVDEQTIRTRITEIGFEVAG